MKKDQLKRLNKNLGNAQNHDGESIVIKDQLWLTCCDCGMRHHLKFSTIDKRGKVVDVARIILTVWSDEWGTQVNRTFGSYLCKEPKKKRHGKRASA